MTAVCCAEVEFPPSLSQTISSVCTFTDGDKPSLLPGQTGLQLLCSELVTQPGLYTFLFLPWLIREPITLISSPPECSGRDPKPCTYVSFAISSPYFELPAESLINDWHIIKEMKKLSPPLLCTSLIIFTLPDAFRNLDTPGCKQHKKRQEMYLQQQLICSIICTPWCTDGVRII